MKFKRISILVVLSISCAVSAEEAVQLPPGMSEVDSARLANGVLALPELKGAITTPGKGWKWIQDVRPEVKAMKGREILLCAGPEGQLFVAAIIPGARNIRNAKVENFRKDLEDLVKPMNGSILSEKGEFVSLPPHPDVFNVKSRVRIGDSEFDHERFVIPAGAHSVIFSSLNMSGTELNRTQFKSFATSLTFVADPKTNPYIFVYFFFAAIFYALALIVNTLAKRTLIGPAMLALLSVFGVYFVRISFFRGSLDPRPGVSHEFSAGYEMGLALFPFIILVFLVSREKKAAREAEARARIERELAIQDREEMANLAES